VALSQYDSNHACAQEEQAERRRKYLEKEAELKRQRKREERERWWSGAEVYFPKESAKKESSATGGKLNAEDARALRVSRYTMDYSKWDTWTPSDDVSRQEELDREEQEEKRRNEEFERNNPDFCRQFMDDMAERKKSTQKKQEIADGLRLKGNKFFKARDYPRALENYMEALKSAPFDPKLLLNIAQAQLKLKDHEVGLEFLNRTLYLDADNVKALSRHAFVLAEQGNTADALLSINKALQLEPQNAELVAQHREISIVEQEKQAERAAAALKSQLQVSSATTASTAPAALTAPGDEENKSQVSPPKATSAPSTAAPSAAAAAAAASVAALSEAELLGAIDQLQLQLAPLSAATQPITALDLHSVVASLNRIAGASSVLNEAALPMVRAYFRTSNALHATLLLAKNLWTESVKSQLTSASTAAGTETAAEQHVDVAAFLSTLAVVGSMVQRERSAKQLLLDHKFISGVVKDVLSAVQHEIDLSHHAAATAGGGKTTTGAVHPLRDTWLQTANSAWRLLATCTEDDTNLKCRTFVWHDKPLWASWAHGLGTIVSLVARSADDRAAAVLSTLIRFGESSFREESGRQALQDVCTEESSMGMLLMGSIGSLVQLLSAPRGVEPATVSQWAESTMSILLGLSQVEALRKHAAMTLPPLSPSTSDSDTLVTLLVRAVATAAAGSFADHTSNVLAILLNVTIATATAVTGAGETNDDASSAVRKSMVDAGVMTAALQSLTLPFPSSAESGRAYREDDEADVLLRCRFAGLLSRLAVLPSVMLQFIAPSSGASGAYVNYTALCRRFAYLVRRTSSTTTTTAAAAAGAAGNERIEKWLREELQHLLRSLAALPTSVAGGGIDRAALCRIVKEQGVIEALLQLFPEPKRDGGEFTPFSVTLLPSTTELPSPVLLGNAARCLLHYADEVVTAQDIFLQEKWHGIEKLICGMATITDIRVRRNISIVLAKGIKAMSTQPNGQRVRERITHYRGLQMMIQLQDQL
jgi:tetratricopeptide (TPR) repeat protein